MKLTHIAPSSSHRTQASPAQQVALGLIGAGRWGRRFIDTIQSMDSVVLSSVASKNPDTPGYVPGASVVGDWRELLDADLDGVIIATPPAYHGEMLRAFVAAGIPSMVEKPLCLDLDEAYELRNFVHASGVPVLVDHTQLFHPALPVLKKLAKDLGQVLFIRSEGMGFSPFRSDVPVLWDWAPHDVSLIVDLLGTVPHSVSALGDANSAAMRLEFSGGTKAWIANSNMSVERRRLLAVHFERRVLVLDDCRPDSLVEYELDPASADGVPLLGTGTALPVPDEMPLTRAVSYFAEGILGGDQTRFGLDFACDVMRTIDAAQRSMDAGCEVATLDLAL